MSDASKIHSIKSKSVSLKEAAELLNKCAEDKKLARIVLMRETAQDIVRLLTDLEKDLSVKKIILKQTGQR